MMYDISWASPAACASGRAGVNQARYAVLASRLSSLTHPANAGLIQASAYQQTTPHPGTRFPALLLQAKAMLVDPVPLIPTISRR